MDKKDRPRIKTFWTSEELAYLKNDNMTIQEIADKLGRTYTSVAAKKHMMAKKNNTVKHNSEAKKNRVNYIPDDTHKVMNRNLKENYTIKQEDCLKLYETIEIGTTINVLLTKYNRYNDADVVRTTTGTVIAKYPFYCKVKVDKRDVCVQWPDVGRMNLHLLP